MPFPPQLYLIGAQKAGTTTLSYLLGQHPDVCLSRPKETHFFAREWHRGLAWYEQRFSTLDAKVLLDASTTYTMAAIAGKRSSSSFLEYFPDVPQRIHSLARNAKFIYLLRDPVDRTYSAYFHYFSRGVERRCFEQTLQEESFYLDVSDYHGQLLPWLDYFPIDAFHFVLFEDFKRDPLGVAESCLRFARLDPRAVELTYRVKNQARDVNWLGRQLNRGFAFVDRYNFHLVPPFLRRRIKLRESLRRLTSQPRQPTSLTPEIRTYLQTYFADKNRQLENLIGLSLARWQTDSNQEELQVPVPNSASVDFSGEALV